MNTSTVTMGRGIGASHQTGWTGCIARIIQALGFVTPEIILDTMAPGELTSSRR